MNATLVRSSLLAVIALFLAGCASEASDPAESAWRLVRGDHAGDKAEVLMRGARYQDLALLWTGSDEAAPAAGNRLQLTGLTTPEGDAIAVVWPGGGSRLALPACVLGSESPRVEREGVAAADLPVRIVRGWWSLAPPLIAILLAVLVRQVLVALFLGAVMGAVVLHGGLAAGILRTVDLHIVGALADESHLKILIFSSLLGAVVAMVSRMGGMRAVVDALVRRSDSRRGVQFGTWLMGIVVFFDDYANALLVGNTVRPASDRYRISREKLAYLVDATSAPVACIAVISTWIVAQVAYVDDWLQEVVRETPEGVAGFTEGYPMFLASIPYNFYPLLALFFGLFLVLTRRDFGPMLKAERRAIHEGQLLRPGATPMAGEEIEQAEADAPTVARWWNGVVPILTLVVAVVLGLYYSGIESATSEGFWTRLREAYGAADSYNVLIMATLLALGVAWVLGLGQRILTLHEAAETCVRGIKAMLVALLVLTLAWTLSDLCSALNTSGFLIESVTLSFEGLPAVTFLLAAVVGFSTGSSWGTMGILIPLTMAYAHQAGLAVDADPAALQAVLLGTLGAVLAGAVFGDHCSPISDTTVMSSMAAGSDHIDHVKTQMPYALVVGAVALLAGYLPAGFGFPAWASLLLGMAALAVIILRLGKRAEETA